MISNSYVIRFSTPVFVCIDDMLLFCNSLPCIFVVYEILLSDSFFDYASFKIVDSFRGYQSTDDVKQKKQKTENKTTPKETLPQLGENKTNQEPAPGQIQCFPVSNKRPKLFHIVTGKRKRSV